MKIVIGANPDDAGDDALALGTLLCHALGADRQAKRSVLDVTAAEYLAVSENCRANVEARVRAVGATNGFLGRSDKSGLGPSMIEQFKVL